MQKMMDRMGKKKKTVVGIVGDEKLGPFIYKDEHIIKGKQSSFLISNQAVVCLLVKGAEVVWLQLESHHWHFY